VQSNHTRQVAAVAARLGLKARLVQESWVDWPDSVNDRVGNILLSRIMGADVRLVEDGFGIGIKSSWEQALDDVRAAGGTPYAIPAGASDHRLGGLGFAHWADEVRQQEQRLGVFFDTIIVCSVTGSTQAGMIAGFAGQDRPRRVLGIDASAKPGRPARPQRVQRAVPLGDRAAATAERVKIAGAVGHAAAGAGRVGMVSLDGHALRMPAAG
jgi:1-aminocyclopropane-1-carboxylate deaminase